MTPPEIELQQQLDALQPLSPEYGQGLSDHLPMALHALTELGADATGLRAWAQRYRTEHRPAGEPPPGFAALRATWLAALSAEGRDAVLTRALPTLWAGAAGVAFHGLIRAGHAAQTGHLGELASALAYWAWRAQPMPPVPDAPAMPLAAWWARLEAAARQEPATPGALISARMALVSQGPRWAAVAPGFDPGAEPAQGLAQLAAWVAEAYARSGSFTVLHMLTGLRAVQVLLPWVGDARTELRPLGPALAAALMASTYRPRLDLPTGGLADRSDLQHQALRQQDAHAVKLVHAALDWAHWHPEAAPVFEAAAQRALR